MPLFLYIEPPTRVHALHPIVKVSGMLAVFVAAFVCERPLSLLPLTTFTALLIAAANGLPNVRRLRWLFGLVFVMTFVVWTLFFRGGTPWLSWGPVRVSASGLEFALGMALKLVTFLSIGVVFLSTTKIEELAWTLTRVGVPYKLGFTMTLAFRLVPVFLDSATTVVQAQRCRGFDFDQGSIIERVRRYVPVIVPVFMGALRRADGMAMALEARGFQSGRPRTAYEHYRFRLTDAAALLVAAALAAGYVGLWYAGYTAVRIA